MEGGGLVKIPRVGATLLNVFPWTLNEERGVGEEPAWFCRHSSLFFGYCFGNDFFLTHIMKCYLSEW